MSADPRWTCLLALAMAACGGQSVSIRESEGFEMLRDGGYRLAVLPFVVTAPSDSTPSEPPGALGCLLALEGVSESAPPTEHTTTIVRRSFVAALDASPLQVSELWVTDTRLRHAGLTVGAFGDVARGAELARLLDVDGVVFGEITEWDRDATAQSTPALGLRIRLVDRRSEEVILEVERREDRGARIAGGPRPTVAGAPLAELARSLARHAAADLTGTMATDAIDPTAARGGAPVLSFQAVVAERDRPLRAGDRLEVVAIGTADCQASFDIGRYRTRIPMVPVARTEDPRGARATYVGHYTVQPGERLVRVPIFLSLTRQEGGRALRSKHRLVDASVTIGD